MTVVDHLVLPRRSNEPSDGILKGIPLTFSSPCVFAADASVSEVLEPSVSPWDEGRLEDELSPEEIQMVCRSQLHTLSLEFSECRHCSVDVLKSRVTCDEFCRCLV